MFRDLIIYTPTFVCGLWMIVLLSSPNKRNKAKLFLGLFFVCGFLLFLSYDIFYLKYKDSYLLFDLIYIVSDLSIFPMYYLYIKLLTKKTSVHFKDFKIFLPALVVFFASLFTYLLMPPIQRTLYLENHLFNNGQLLHQGWLIVIQALVAYAVKVIFIGQIIYFLIKIKGDIKKYSYQIAGFYSNLNNKNIDWGQRIFNSIVAISILSFVIHVLGRAFFLESIFFMAIPSLSFSFLLFIFGYYGNLQNHSATKVYKHGNTAHIVLGDCNKKDLKLRLIELFVLGEVYKNPNLKMTDIALQLNSNRTYISNIVNKEFATSFCVFVNQFRVGKAKELLIDEEHEKHTLEAISEEVGFGTLHSFIRVFKELEGTTPGNYREVQKSRNMVLT